MAIDLQEQLVRVGAKTTLVLEKYALMKQRLAEARGAVERLTEQLRQRDSEIEQLRLRLEYLMVSHTVASGGEDLQKTKALIDELVRDIDSCLADLND